MTSVLEEIEGIILTVLYAITMLVTFAGNGFLIYIVWKKPEVRSLTSFMFVNMAIADLLVALIVMPWSITQVHTDGLWMIPGVFNNNNNTQDEFSYFSAFRQNLTHPKDLVKL